MTITIATGVGSSVPVMADCILKFGAAGDLFLSMLDGQVVPAMSVSLLEGVLNGLAISLPRSFPLMQYAQTIQ